MVSVYVDDLRVKTVYTKNAQSQKRVFVAVTAYGATGVYILCFLSCHINL